MIAGIFNCSQSVIGAWSIRTGIVVDVLVQSRGDTKAVMHLMRQILKVKDMRRVL